MWTNAFVRDVDVSGANPGDGRRQEVVVDGLARSTTGNWQSTMATADHGEEPLRWMEWPSLQPGRRRNEGALSSSACRRGLDGLLAGKWEKVHEETNGFHGPGQGTCTERNSTSSMLPLVTCWFFSVVFSVFLLHVTFWLFGSFPRL